MMDNLQRTPHIAPQQPAQQPSVLDVAASVMGKRWTATPVDERLAAGIAQAYDVPEIVARILVARGVAFDQVQSFMNPAIKTDLPDPYTLKDMEKAATRIADAVMNDEKTAVFGDYDVDGATSTALLKRYFKSLGRDITVYIPDRIAEGYGPNIAALEKLRGDGVSFLITADCGVTSHDVIAAGNGLGLDIVVLDHHRAEPALPDAVAVVNPNRLDDDSGQGHLCAAGVVFLTMVAVNRILRERGWFAGGRTEPRILQWLDLVALGTVCDVVPLTGVNRAFVAQGLKVMAMRQNAGLVALAALNNLTDAPNTFHAGFVFGPRVNAGGRVGTSTLGTRLLSTDDPIEARDIAAALQSYNSERKAMEEDVLADALAQVEAMNPDSACYIVAGDGWHPGVIGIVAARIKEKYNRPACVVAFDGAGVGKASGRSVPHVDLGGAVIAARQHDILIAGGGHKMAAGFTVMRDRLDDLRAFIDAHIAQQLDGAVYTPALRIDQVVSVAGLNMALAEKLAQLGPYGAGHSEPRFAVTGAKIIRPKVVGERHVSCFIQDAAGSGSVKAIAFRAMDTALGETLLTAGSQPFYLAGQVSINHWQGRASVNFQIVDAAPVWE